MLDRKQIGKRLKNAREFKGLRLVDASNRSGINHISIIKYEKGLNQPTLINALRLAEAYQMSLDDIFLPNKVSK